MATVESLIERYFFLLLLIRTQACLPILECTLLEEKAGKDWIDQKGDLGNGQKFEFLDLSFNGTV
jgi:hypothetical protein